MFCKLLIVCEFHSIRKLSGELRVSENGMFISWVKGVEQVLKAVTGKLILGLSQGIPCPLASDAGSSVHSIAVMRICRYPNKRCIHHRGTGSNELIPISLFRT